MVLDCSLEPLRHYRAVVLLACCLVSHAISKNNTVANDKKGYTIMGSICLAVMLCLGEMIAFLPVPGGHIALAERFVDKAFAFTMGWNYWYNWS